MADVTRVDQEKINAFSKLNTRMHELEAEIGAKRSEAQEYEEAENEVMLLDDDDVPFLVGECFVHVPREEAEGRLQTLQRRARDEGAALAKEMAAVKARMAALKTELYAKFGTAINLEE